MTIILLKQKFITRLIVPLDGMDSQNTAKSAKLLLHIEAFAEELHCYLW